MRSLLYVTYTQLMLATFIVNHHTPTEWLILHVSYWYNSFVLNLGTHLAIVMTLWECD